MRHQLNAAVFSSTSRFRTGLLDFHLHLFALALSSRQFDFPQLTEDDDRSSPSLLVSYTFLALIDVAATGAAVRRFEVPPLRSRGCGRSSAPCYLYFKVHRHPFKTPALMAGFPVLVCDVLLPLSGLYRRDEIRLSTSTARPLAYCSDPSPGPPLPLCAKVEAPGPRLSPPSSSSPSAPYNSTRRSCAQPRLRSNSSLRARPRRVALVADVPLLLSTTWLHTAARAAAHRSGCTASSRCPSFPLQCVVLVFPSAHPPNTNVTTPTLLRRQRCANPLHISWACPFAFH
ncbi:hypothetical protein B0H11DRAFT_2224439 [Mycena galericulata]|nr:hypothetical protein B0H11DRAFT_2224439 [Mycena galericulata]